MRAGGRCRRTRLRCGAHRGAAPAARACRRRRRRTPHTAAVPAQEPAGSSARRHPNADPASPKARRARGGRRRQAALRPPQPRENRRRERPLLRTNCSARATRSAAYLVQDPLQGSVAASPFVTAFLSTRPRHSPGPRESIRRPGYRYEHMFPFRPSSAVTALLELADALLAPADPTTALDDAVMSTPSACGAPHPHRRPLARTTRRRPAPLAQPQPCLTPLGGPGRRAPGRPAPIGDAAA